MNLRTRLAELAKIAKAPAPVVSVYLNTLWADEHQRDRVRIFLKNRLAEARQPRSVRAADTDLDWVEAQGAALVEQAAPPEAGNTPGAPPLRVSLEVLDVPPLDVRQAAARSASGTCFTRGCPSRTLSSWPKRRSCGRWRRGSRQRRRRSWSSWTARARA